ncbi:hypothetical protein FA95DRAFT_1585117 [Auriscalpium vulgare]|uniref:Uncharacterized protein n=1 Tax=Auriscalpium vulgare TaxID=40419 RepID=A0ACB8R8K3_9AGAM|nr:hypothetical protein FA95DRAFT_1585117 [Auriscalpium vulgare]
MLPPSMPSTSAPPTPTMSHSSTPQPASGSGYASPARSSSSTPAPTAHMSKTSAHKPKPTNVFSNDGSFLERFQRLQKDEEERKKQDELLEKKRTFDNRFKNRGKRSSPDDPSSKTSADDPPSKKARADAPMSQYEKELKSYNGGRILKEDGMGVRPLVK